jgi:outer membrane protein assembly factor BamB
MPAIGADGTIYVGSWDYNLYAVKPDGSEKWKFFAGNPVPSPAISADGTIYVGSGNDRHLYAINPDGALKWKFTTGVIQAIASPAIGPDGIIYFGSDDGNLYAGVPPQDRAGANVHR